MIQIKEIGAEENWQHIRNFFYQSLTSPFDGMWDELIHDHGAIWGFYENGTLIGYCSKSDSGILINFFLTSDYRHLKSELFDRALYVLEAREAIVSTNNPDFLVLSLDKKTRQGRGGHSIFQFVRK